MAESTISFKFLGKEGGLLDTIRQSVASLKGVAAANDEATAAYQRSKAAIEAFKSSSVGSNAQLSAEQARLKASILEDQAAGQLSAKQAQEQLFKIESAGLSKRIELQRSKIAELKALQEQANLPGPALPQKRSQALNTDLLQAEQELSNLRSTAAQRAIAANANVVESTGKIGFSVTELASKYFLVVQALQGVLAVGKTVYGSLIQQNVELQEQLLGTQTSLASTNKVFANGIELTDPTAAIQALEGPVNDAVARLRKGSLDLVGVTSAQLIPLFQNIAGQSSAIGADLEQSADLSLKFAAALGTFKIPLEQQRQEVSSILQANITQDSILAKSLNITNDQVKSWKANGTAVAELTKRLEAAAAGNRLAAQTFGGIGSNIKEIFDNVTLAAGQPLTEEITRDLGAFYKFLTDNQDAIQAFVSQGADLILGLVQNFKEFGSEAGANLQPVFEQLAPIAEKLAPIFGLVVVGLEKLLIRGSELIEQNIALKVFLATADAALTLVQALGQLNGDYAAGTEAVELYGQRSSAIAQEAVDALGKQARGERDATAAKKEAIAKINDQLKALKGANVTGSENRAVLRGQITELEQYKGKLEGAGGAIKLVSKDTTQLTSDLKLLTEEYEKQGAAVALAQAQLTAAIKRSQIASGEGAVTSAKEAQAQINRIEQEGLQQKLKAAQVQADGIRAIQAKGGNEDQQKEFAKNLTKIQTEAATLEGQLADKTREGKKQILDNQLKDLEVFQAQANDAIAASETAQLTRFEQFYQTDLSRKQELELLKLAAAQDRVNAEIEAEQERTKTLQNLKFSDPDDIEANEGKIRVSKQKTAQLTLKALENQRSLEQAVTEIRLRGLRNAADEAKNASEARIGQLTEELKRIELITGSLDRQDKLRKAQLDLSNAQTALATTGGQIELDNLTRALEIRKRLSDAQTSPEVKAVLAQQLAILTGKPNTSEAEIAAQKVRAENQLQQIKRQGLVLEQAIARQTLETDLQRNRLAAERLVIESKNAALASQQAQNEAQNRLDQLRADPSADPQAIRNAEAQVQRTAQTSRQADQNVGASEANLAQQGQLETLARQSLDAQQLAAKAQFQAADAARIQAAQLTLVEAKARNIAQILRQTTPVDQLNRRTNQLAAQFDRQAQPFALPGTTIAPATNTIRVSPATVQVNQAAQPDQLAPLRDLVNLQRESNAHLRAIANRRPVEKIEKNTTIVQNPVVRSNGGLPR
jgi:hypothetical protein